MKAWIWIGAVSIWWAIGIEVLTWINPTLGNRILDGFIGLVVFFIPMSILLGCFAVFASLLLSLLGLGRRG